MAVSAEPWHVAMGPNRVADSAACGTLHLLSYSILVKIRETSARHNGGRPSVGRPPNKAHLMDPR